MKHLLRITVLLICASGFANDQTWINGEWQGDPDQFLKLNPVIAQMDEDGIRAHTDQVKQIRWTFEDGVWTASNEGQKESIAYSTRPLPNDRFEILINDEHGVIWVVWKTTKGFCAKRRNIWYKAEAGNEHGIPEGWHENIDPFINCFARAA